jgi:hypothetical protein
MGASPSCSTRSCPTMHRSGAGGRYLSPKRRSSEWVNPYTITVPPSNRAPEFKSCCGIYLRSCITTHVPALLPSTGLLLNFRPAPPQTRHGAIEPPDLILLAEGGESQLEPTTQELGGLNVERVR